MTRHKNPSQPKADPKPAPKSKVGSHPKASEPKAAPAPKASHPKPAPKSKVASKPTPQPKPSAQPDPQTVEKAAQPVAPPAQVTKKSIPPRPQSKSKAVPSKNTKEPELKVEDEEQISEDLQTKKPRAPRKKVSLEGHLAKYDEILEMLDVEIERRQKEREKGTRIFRTIRKTMREMKAQVPKVANARRRTIRGGNKVSGFVLKCQITDRLADFMQIPHGSTVTRNEITNAICMYSRINAEEKRPQMLKWAHLNPDGKRNLQNPNNKMALVPDKTLSALLHYDEYVKNVKAGNVTEQVTDKATKRKEIVKVTDPSLRYRVIQRLIQNQIVKTLKLSNEDAAEKQSSLEK